MADRTWECGWCGNGYGFDVASCPQCVVSVIGRVDARPPGDYDRLMQEKAEEFAQDAHATWTADNEAIVSALLCVATQIARLVEVSK